MRPLLWSVWNDCRQQLSATTGPRAS